MPVGLWTSPCRSRWTTVVSSLTRRLHGPTWPLWLSRRGLGGVRGGARAVVRRGGGRARGGGQRLQDALQRLAGQRGVDEPRLVRRRRQVDAARQHRVEEGRVAGGVLAAGVVVVAHLTLV